MPLLKAFYGYKKVSEGATVDPTQTYPKICLSLMDPSVLSIAFNVIFLLNHPKKIVTEKELERYIAEGDVQTVLPSGKIIKKF